MQENTTPDFTRLFEVDPSSPTGLKWKDNINDGITGRGRTSLPVNLLVSRKKSQAGLQP